MNDYELRKQAKEEAKMAGERKRTTRRVVKGIVFPIALVVIIVGLFVYSSGDDGAGVEDGPLGDVVVLNNRGQFHIHTELKIFIDGEEIPIPQGIGVVGHNLLAVHTHVGNGVLHMHKSGIVTKRDISLGKFFEIWDEPFTPTCVLDHCETETNTLTIAVNGVINEEYGNYVMNNNDKILISLGEEDAVALSEEHYNFSVPVDSSE